jgi:DNA-binding transcriptional regulator YhcF (GntR family)
VVTATDTADAVTSVVLDGAGWPLQPLLDASGLTARRLAAELGLSGTTVRQAAKRGLSDRQADEWAIRLGLHPLLVWGWAWIDPSANALRPAATRLADALRARIARGEVHPGERLPGVHVLAEQSGFGSKTVVRALDELRAEGLVVGGIGRGRPATIASTVPANSAATCVTCGRAIEEGEEHYPHRPHCTMASHGWCDCDQAAHPDCCPTCAGGGS